MAWEDLQEGILEEFAGCSGFERRLEREESYRAEALRRKRDAWALWYWKHQRDPGRHEWWRRQYLKRRGPLVPSSGTCGECGREWSAPHRRGAVHRRFCSSRCRDAWWSRYRWERMGEAEREEYRRVSRLLYAQRRGAVEKTCGHCGEAFRVEPGAKTSRRYCGRRCQDRHNKGRVLRPESVSCEQCGKPVPVKSSGGPLPRWCSRRCERKWRSQRERVQEDPAGGA